MEPVPPASIAQATFEQLALPLRESGPNRRVPGSFWQPPRGASCFQYASLRCKLVPSCPPRTDRLQRRAAQDRFGPKDWALLPHPELSLIHISEPTRLLSISYAV